jgi:hypothetical protein
VAACVDHCPGHNNPKLFATLAEMYVQDASARETKLIKAELRGCTVSASVKWGNHQAPAQRPSTVCRPQIEDLSSLDEL